MIDETPLDDVALSFLAKLNDQTVGDQSAQVSMYDVGQALGLEKDQAGNIAEELIGMGLIEIRTLSGGIGITAEGQSHVQTPDQASAPDVDRLGPGPIMNEADLTLVQSLLLQIKTDIREMGLSYDALEELMADLRTVDTQLLSPKPKTAIVRACLKSIGDTVASTGPGKYRERLRAVAGDA